MSVSAFTDRRVFSLALSHYRVRFLERWQPYVYIQFFSCFAVASFRRDPIVPGWTFLWRLLVFLINGVGSRGAMVEAGSH